MAAILDSVRGRFAWSGVRDDRTEACPDRRGGVFFGQGDWISDVFACVSENRECAYECHGAGFDVAGIGDPAACAPNETRGGARRSECENWPSCAKIVGDLAREKDALRP